jgi:hypothetical protein
MKTFLLPVRSISHEQLITTAPSVSNHGPFATDTGLLVTLSFFIFACVLTVLTQLKVVSRFAPPANGPSLLEPISCTAVTPSRQSPASMSWTSTLPPALSPCQRGGYVVSRTSSAYTSGDNSALGVSDHERATACAFSPSTTKLTAQSDHCPDSSLLLV